MWSEALRWRTARGSGLPVARPLVSQRLEHYVFYFSPLTSQLTLAIIEHDRSTHALVNTRLVPLCHLLA